MDATLEDRARVFATAAHAAVGQKCKYTGDPYIRHPAAVAAILRANVPGVLPEQLAAGWLHDVVEDTDVTLDLIRAEFGEVVASLVGDLTDVSRPDDGNSAVRKAMDREHTARASALAKTVKLADLIDNARTITERDPKFAEVYFREKAALVALMGDADPVLLQLACKWVEGQRA